MPLASVVLVMILVIAFIIFPVLGRVATWLCENYKGENGYWKYWLVGICIALCLLIMYIIIMALGNFYLLI